jgi:hypothetical protein
MYLWAQTARVDVGLLSPLPLFEIYLRSARHSCRVFRVVLFQFLSAAGQTKASKRLVWLEDRASKRLRIG